MINLGGNLLKSVQSPLASEIQFAEDPYLYKYIKIEAGQSLPVSGLAAACVFLLSGELKCGEKSLSKVGDSLQTENMDITLYGVAAQSCVLLVGCGAASSGQQKLDLLQLSQLKRVEKPWGYEVWITGEHPGYCLKKIFIKAGTKTSLQYHRQKRETNVLFEGTARFHFKKNPLVANDDVTATDLDSSELVPMSSIDVFPFTLHRLEAVTDILLYEVSTPHLNDVVRVADDTKRPDGRINSEHEKSKPKVCILTAGCGKRLGEYSKVINKGLLPLEGKAVLSHIIEKFSKDSEFVVAVGYKAEQVKTYLNMAHPGHSITFVQVENFDGPESGPGLSALACRKELDREFYLVCSDTLWTEKTESFPTSDSWMGTSYVDAEISQNFCNLQIENDSVVAIIDKAKSSGLNSRAFAGLAFVKEPELFWRGLEMDVLTNNEKQLSLGFQEILKYSSLKVNEITWTDVGTEQKYIAELKRSSNFDFSKSREYIFVVNNSVIKFYEDQKIARQRVEKVKLNPSVFPPVDKFEGSFYRYEYQPGETLYRQTDLPLFQKLIEWLDQNLWKKSEVPTNVMNDLCHKFYYLKTYDRISQFKLKYKDYDKISEINGKRVPQVDELLANVDWSALSSGIASFIHGDLQPDNILYDVASDKFLLLDWRQDFAGRIDIGDIYYDFAKLWGGLLLNYDQIKLNKFSYTESGNKCDFQFPSHPHVTAAHSILEIYLKRNGYSMQKIRLIVGLIYLNMSPLHNYPFDKLLHALGRQIIYNSAKERNAGG